MRNADFTANIIDTLHSELNNNSNGQLREYNDK